jgi:hypothetical protein
MLIEDMEYAFFTPRLPSIRDFMADYGILRHTLLQ